MLVLNLFYFSHKASPVKSALWFWGWVCPALPSSVFLTTGDTSGPLEFMRREETSVSSLSSHHSSCRAQLPASLVAASHSHGMALRGTYKQPAKLFCCSEYHIFGLSTNSDLVFAEISAVAVRCAPHTPDHITWWSAPVVSFYSMVPAFSFLFSQPRSGNGFLSSIASGLYQDLLFCFPTLLHVQLIPSLKPFLFK